MKKNAKYGTKKNSEVNENNVPFDGDNNPGLSEVNKNSAKISKNLKNNLQDKENSGVDVKKIILDIIGEYKISDDDLSDILGKLTRGDLERIKENKDLILEITGYGFCIDHLKKDGKGLSELTREDLERIKENRDLILEIIGKKWFLMSYLSKYGKGLSELTRGDLERIKIICRKLDKEKDMSTIVGMYKIMKNSNIIKMKNYIERKENYLENNELMSEDEFKKLFGGLGKYGKGEINQKRLKYCYFYTALELLKKMNFFEVLVRTNIRQSENGNGWYVRLPMGQSDGKWIHISEKNEINGKFDIPDEEGGIRKQISITSDSPLGFKILEIAYIKKELINRDEKIKQEFSKTGDITLTGDGIALLEGGWTDKALKTLIGDNNVVGWPTDYVSEDITFDYFNKGLMVHLDVKDNVVNCKIKLNRYGKISTEITEKEVKIISNNENIKTLKSGYIKQNDDSFKLMENCSEEMLEDVIDIDDEKQAIFYKGHAYSLERCYVDKSSGEKRVWIVNPWHTGIKFDISLEKCKKIFDWYVSYIDFDNLFR